MYSLYDLYTDLIAGRRSDFEYNNHEFNVVVEPGVVTVVLNGHTPTSFPKGKKLMCFALRSRATCMTDLQGYAACLLHYKTDLWFDKHGELCTQQQFAQNK